MYFSVDNEFGTLLHVAVGQSNFKMARILLEKGKIPINSQDKHKIQPIHIAATKNDIGLIKYLVENGADINSVDKFGNLPLGWAHISRTSNQFIDFLISAGADDKPFKSLNEIMKIMNGTVSEVSKLGINVV